MTTPTGTPVPLRAAAATVDPGGVDHGAGEAVLGGLVAELEDLGPGGVGLEQGVVENGGEVLRRGERLSGKGVCVKGLLCWVRQAAHVSPLRAAGWRGLFLSQGDGLWLGGYPTRFCAKSSKNWT